MTPHIDSFVGEPDNQADGPRKAKVTQTEERGAIGAPVFFSSDELKKQGIDPDAVDYIAVRVKDGFVIVDPVRSGNE